MNRFLVLGQASANVALGMYLLLRVYLRRELPQFMPHHILCYPHIVVDLAIVHLENEADKVGEDSCAARLRLDGRSTLSRLGANDWKSARYRSESLPVQGTTDSTSEMMCVQGLWILAWCTHGTIWGPAHRVSRLSSSSGNLIHVPFHTERAPRSENVGRIVKYIVYRLSEVLRTLT